MAGVGQPAGVSSPPATASSPASRSSIDMLWIDRHFEGAWHLLRLNQARLQYAVLEGDTVTQWREIDDRARLAALLRLAAQADLPSLRSFYPPPATQSEGGELTVEQDELIVRFRLSGNDRFIRAPARPSAPESLRQLVDELESAARKDGHSPVRPASSAPDSANAAQLALFVECLDVPNFPAEVTVAQALQNSGVSFPPPPPDALRRSPALQTALERVDWLTPVAGTSDIPPGLPFPAYLTTHGRHVRVRRASVRLVP